MYIHTSQNLNAERADIIIKLFSYYYKMCGLRVPHCQCCGDKLDWIQHIDFCEVEINNPNSCKSHKIIPVYDFCIQNKYCLYHFYESGICGSGLPSPYFHYFDNLRSIPYWSQYCWTTLSDLKNASPKWSM